MDMENTYVHAYMRTQIKLDEYHQEYMLFTNGSGTW